MAPLSKRQETAQALTIELQKMGASVISPLPLDENSKLKFQMLDAERDKVITQLCEWGWIPAHVSPLPRVTTNGLVAASVYEIDLPRPRLTVCDDTIKGELATESKAERERAAPARSRAIPQTCGLTMKRKPDANKPSLRDKLSAAFLECFETDFAANGASVIEQLRNKSPTNTPKSQLDSLLQPSHGRIQIALRTLTRCRNWAADCLSQWASART